MLRLHDGTRSVKGVYRTTHRCALVATQAANSRLFELRNADASNIMIPTSLTISWLQTAAHTAAIEDSLDLYKATGFSAVDTAGTVTPGASVVHGLRMAAAPGSAALRGVTVAGASAGMTGGTLVKDAAPLAQLTKWLLLGLPTAAEVKPDRIELLSSMDDGYPVVLAPNEGLVLENRALLGAAAGSTVYIDFSWAELASL